MKKILVLTASLAATMMITACPGPNDSPGPMPSTTPTPAESTLPLPSESPTPSESASPMPSSSPTTPEATPTPAETESPVGFSLTTATASQLPRFRYQFTIAGTDLGVIADYTTLQVVSSDATVKIIENGVAKNNVEISNVVVTPTSISFSWLPPNGAPTDQDLIKVDYQRAGSDRESTSIRLTVEDGL
jgi:hypothetical protein